jgi:hypothetical protein
MSSPETVARLLQRLLGASRLLRSTFVGCSRQGLSSATCRTIGKALGEVRGHHAGLMVKEGLTAGQTICSLSRASSPAVAPLVSKGLRAFTSTSRPSSPRASWLCSQARAAGTAGLARAAAWAHGASTRVSYLSSQSGDAEVGGSLGEGASTVSAPAAAPITDAEGPVTIRLVQIAQ